MTNPNATISSASRHQVRLPLPFRFLTPFPAWVFGACATPPVRGSDMLGTRLRRVPSNHALGRLNLPYRVNRTRMAAPPTHLSFPGPVNIHMSSPSRVSFLRFAQDNMVCHFPSNMPEDCKAAIGFSPPPMAAGGWVLARRKFNRR